MTKQIKQTEPDIMHAVQMQAAGEFEAMTADGILDNVRSYLLVSAASLQRAYRGMYYLKISERYREIFKYRQTTFNAFLRDVLNVTERKFMFRLELLHRAPDVVELLSHRWACIVDRHGPAMAIEAAKEVEAAIQEKGGPLLKHEEDQAVRKAVPAPPKRRAAPQQKNKAVAPRATESAPRIDWQHECMKLQKKQAALLEDIKDKDDQIASMRQQIKKLHEEVVENQRLAEIYLADAERWEKAYREALMARGNKKNFTPPPAAKTLSGRA